MFGYSDTLTEKMKFLVLLRQNFQVGKGSAPAQSIQALPKLSGREMQTGSTPCPAAPYPTYLRQPWDNVHRKGSEASAMCPMTQAVPKGCRVGSNDSPPMRTS